jgi:hypothetical protein
MPQNFPVSKSGEPHMVHTPAGADIGISATGWTVRSGSLMGDLHMPQYFSSTFMGLLQDLQSFGMAGSTTACGVGGRECRDRGNGDVFPGAGSGSGSDSGKGDIAGDIGSWDSSYWDAPQFLQNFAEEGTTTFPHS